MAVKLEYIYVEEVEAILTDDIGAELRWLREHLTNGIKIMGSKGRYLKADRFLKRIDEQYDTYTKNVG